MFRQPCGILRQSDEYALRYILGRLRIADQPHRGGIHEIKMPPDQLGKSRFRAMLNIIAQKLLVVPVVHS